MSSLIREGKTQGLSNIMETGKGEGMVLMDASVMKLYNEGEISPEVARANISNEIMRRQIT